MHIRITKSRAAMAGLFVLAGVGLASLLNPLIGTALATVGQTVNISDHSASAYFAKVSSDGKLAVGDGAGPLTIDGTVGSRPAAPGSPWRISRGPGRGTSAAKFIVGPTTSAINVTAVSIAWRGGSATGSADVFLYAWYEAPSATTCSHTTFGGALWRLPGVGSALMPIVVTFPTPLQLKPPANGKACLEIAAPGLNPVVVANANGFLG